MLRDTVSHRSCHTIIVLLSLLLYYEQKTLKFTFTQGTDVPKVTTSYKHINVKFINSKKGTVYRQLFNIIYKNTIVKPSSYLWPREWPGLPRLPFLLWRAVTACPLQFLFISSSWYMCLSLLSWTNCCSFSLNAVRNFSTSWMFLLSSNLQFHNILA